MSPRAGSTRKPSVVPRDQPVRRCRVEKRKRVSDDSDSDEDEHELPQRARTTSSSHVKVVLRHVSGCVDLHASVSWSKLVT